MKSLVIAEKPSVARDIARVLKCGKNINGAIEGDRYVVTWGLGHLVTLADPEDYDKKYKEWKMEDYRTDTEMARLLENIKKVRAAYFVKSSTPSTPVKITYDNIYQANDIEQILKDLGDMYDSMVSGQQRLAFRLGTRATGNRR